MIEWTGEFIKRENCGSALAVYPNRAKQHLHFVYPLIEINPRFIIEILHRAISFNLNEVSLCPISIVLSLNGSGWNARAGEELGKFPSVCWDEFVADLDSGGYAEGFFINEKIFIALLGTDETWLILNSEITRKPPDGLDLLIDISVQNAMVMGIDRLVRSYFE